MKNLLSKSDKVVFYTSLAENLGKEVYTTPQVYDVVHKTASQHGLELKMQIGKYVETFLEAIGEGCYEKVLDPSIKWRGMRDMEGYMLSLKSPIEEIKRIIGRHFNVTTDKPTSEKTITIKCEVSEKDNTITARLKKIIDRVWNIYVYYFKENKKLTGISLEEIQKAADLYYKPQKGQVEAWFNASKKLLGIPSYYKFGVSATRSNSYVISLPDPANAILTIAERMKEYGVNYDAEQVLGLKKVAEEELSVSEIIQKRLANAKKKEINKTLLRMGITLEEMRRYFPEAVVMTSFRDNDNVFEISFEKSMEGILNLCLLSIKMIQRPEDKFFDPSIEDMLKSLKDHVYEFLAKY